MTKRAPRQAIGKLLVHKAFESKFVKHPRDIAIWMPPGFRTQPEERYPVMILHDGQNLFDPRTSFIPGHTWNAHRPVARMIRAGQIPPLVLVGVYNTGEHRMDEYTPSRDPARKQGGQAAAYGRMIVEELLPWLVANHRTLPGPRNTALGGSSLGGLATLAIGLQRPDVFGALAAFSPSVWWDRKWMVKKVLKMPARTHQRIWLDMGTREGPGMLEVAREFRDALVTKGWSEGEDLGYLEARGAQHTERAWGRRFGMMMEFLVRT
ncbi:MAG: alpha/beta hydrolase [Acidobacteria bacterium]|nr:alpha/beta hydrolase [Acidobacteriota bacterium]